MGCRPSTPEVIMVTPPDPPPSDIPVDPPPSKLRSYRPSIASLQIPQQDDIISEYASDRSTDEEEQGNKDYLCGTDVSLQWLLQTFADKFNKQFDDEPQWITERLNRPRWNEYAASTVIRVTFGWEEQDLPKTVIIKTVTSKDAQDEELAKYHYLMFRRECNAYDWTQKYPKIAAPRIIHTKRHAKEFSGVVVMEDVAERGVQQDAVKGLSVKYSISLNPRLSSANYGANHRCVSPDRIVILRRFVDVTRELLHQLAVLHTLSIKQNSWNTLVADLPPSYYSHMASGYNEAMDFFERHDVRHSWFIATAEYFASEYLNKMSTEAFEEAPPKVLVHGEPYAANVFMESESKESRIAAIIDWTGCHPGCFGEDIAKAICWNLSTKDRLECTEPLLEDYHTYLVENSSEDSQITLEAVQKAFNMFLPVAVVTFLQKVMANKNKEDIEPLIERAKGLIKSVYLLTHRSEEQ
ncbi:hypothetical protein KIN20_001601 [Parelaphostrongylus tenuis]|uniref:CHK kinase-like domain-containing protein n=1 Tax=Parelaphostrongylus tenuis TaxID=148309 RepID=A0AAD5LTX4_PARTN|nr:hypothetical protein KIN20_001601 [Parelaphostrongylus tenuis]